jgi:hypothetical protein
MATACCLFPDKSWVTGEFLQDWGNILSGDAYIILTLDDGIVFKIVDNLIKEEGKLMLYSLNPIYEPFEVHVKDIREVWKFVHYISEEIPEPSLTGDQIFRSVAKLKKELEGLKRQLKK